MDDNPKNGGRRVLPFQKATEVKALNPHLRIAYDPAGVIGMWCESMGRFYSVCCLAITGEWVRMPFEVLVDGKHLPRTWTEVYNAEPTMAQALEMIDDDRR